MNPNTYVAIMAGGVGSRFWPASRESKPKQFLDITGDGRSLLRITFERCSEGDHRRQDLHRDQRQVPRPGDGALTGVGSQSGSLRAEP